MKVVFILPGRGGGGGHHSVVQESLGLLRLGVEVSIAVNHDCFEDLSLIYPELAGFGISTPLFTTPDDLEQSIAGADLAVATTAPSATMLAECLERLKDRSAVRGGYYIQDYEPLLYTPGAPEWEQSRRSYSALADGLLFAKTEWMCGLVYENHARVVERVKPSIDHGTYFPGPPRGDGPLVVGAMIRPRTPRRAPKRTARILGALSDLHADRIELVSFGCSELELEASGLRLPTRVRHRGVLSRREVATTLRDCDLFLDLSDYQAFGRTGLEAMACGCVPLLPLFGGAAEYVRHWENGWLIDTRSDEAIIATVGDFVAAGESVRRRMREAAIATALDYTIDKAAFSEYRAFSRFLG